MKVISISIIIALALPLSARAEDRFLDTKTAGKLAMIAILSAIAFVVKILVWLTGIGRRSPDSTKGSVRLTEASSFRKDSTTGEWNGMETVSTSFATVFSTDR